jgi:hypothetical protein
MKLIFCAFITLASIIFGVASLAHGQAFTDPGFETYVVNSGGFVKPSSGPWQFFNDAGVVEPFAANSSTGALYNWSATFAAYEGQQYASTYAGFDSLSQSILFSAAGKYKVSVYAAAPDGFVTIPPSAPFPLEDGEFLFTLGSMAIGSTNIVPKGSSWNLYSANFNIGQPGNYTLWVRNTKTASYFINYDAFAIEVVPEPTTLQLLLTAGALVAVFRILRSCRHARLP